MAGPQQLASSKGGRASAIAAAIALAAALAVPAEGLRLTTYKDPVGILTVCYGTTGAEAVPGKKYTLAECKALLSADMRQAVEQVEQCHPGLPVEVMAAFGDAVYNCGPKVACASTASKLLAAGSYRAACQELQKWNKAGGKVLPGLTKRRRAELDLCLRGADGPPALVRDATASDAENCG